MDAKFYPAIAAIESDEGETFRALVYEERRSHRSVFNSDGSLKPEAGKINWPFGNPKSRSWTNDRQSILNNAFVYACMGGHIPAADLLLDKGAESTPFPPGLKILLLRKSEKPLQFGPKPPATRNSANT
jgi:hypothetical protein